MEKQTNKQKQPKNSEKNVAKGSWEDVAEPSAFPMHDQRWRGGGDSSQALGDKNLYREQQCAPTVLSTIGQSSYASQPPEMQTAALPSLIW